MTFIYGCLMQVRIILFEGIKNQLVKQLTWIERLEHFSRPVVAVLSLNRAKLELTFYSVRDTNLSDADRAILAKSSAAAV